MCVRYVRVRITGGKMNTTAYAKRTLYKPIDFFFRGVLQRFGGDSGENETIKIVQSRTRDVHCRHNADDSAKILNGDFRRPLHTSESVSGRRGRATPRSTAPAITLAMSALET